VKLLWVTLQLANKNRHHTRISCFLVKKTCRRAKQIIFHLLAVSKMIWQTILAVMLCQVVVGYPVPDGQKPLPRPQSLVSGCGNLQKGQIDHVLPAGSFKNSFQKSCCCQVV
jgi:hypothetical protein